MYVICFQYLYDLLDYILKSIHIILVFKGLKNTPNVPCFNFCLIAFFFSFLFSLPHSAPAICFCFLFVFYSLFPLNLDKLWDFGKSDLKIIVLTVLGVGFCQWSQARGTNNLQLYQPQAQWQAEMRKMRQSASWTSPQGRGVGGGVTLLPAL